MIATGLKEQDHTYYNKIYSASREYKKHWSESVYLPVWKKILEWLPKNKNTKILDAGCGSGQLVSMLYDTGYKNIKGIDFSEDAIKLSKVNCEVADIFSFDVSEYDLIICTEVLEHIEKDVELLKSWNKNVIFSVPSFGDPAHVRYFQGIPDVLIRYGGSRCEKINKWFVCKI